MKGGMDKMGVQDILKAIKSGEYLLELHSDNNVPDDVVIWGAITEKENQSGLGRQEFAFRGDQQNEFLVGLAEIINDK